MAYPSGAIEKNPPEWEYRTIVGAGRFEVDLEVNRAAREEGWEAIGISTTTRPKTFGKPAAIWTSVLMRRHPQGWRG